MSMKTIENNESLQIRVTVNGSYVIMKQGGREIDVYRDSRKELAEEIYPEQSERVRELETALEKVRKNLRDAGYIEEGMTLSIINDVLKTQQP